MSEQTSPMHDPVAAIEAQTTGPSRALPRIDVAGILTGDTARLMTFAAMVAILIVAAVLRLTYGTWDDTIGPGARPAHLHPDERFLTQISLDTRAPSGPIEYFDTDVSPLNPYNIVKEDGSKQPTFVYGTLPLFLNTLAADQAGLPYTIVDTITFGNASVINSALEPLPGNVGLPTTNFANYDDYTISGRFLAGVFDLGTILFAFLLGRQLANRRVGVLAAGLYAFAPFAIQNSHFFIVDPFVAFFATGCVYFAVRSAQAGGWTNFLLAGAMGGLAAACKITAVSLLPVVWLAILVYVWPGIRPYLAPLWAGDTKEYEEARDGRKLDKSVFTLVIGSIVVLLAGFAAFRVAMPYAFNTPNIGDWLSLESGKIWKFPTFYPDIINQQWLKDQTAQQELLGGNAAFPPNVQWIGRSKWLWPVQQMTMWGMGPALGITAWIGVAFAAVYAWRKGQGAWLVPLAWVLGYLGFMGMQFSLYMRYFLPLYPTLAVFAAFALHKSWEWASSERPLASLGAWGDRLRSLQPFVAPAVRAGVVVVVVFTIGAGLAFYNIYREPVTRAAASQWFYENVPEGSVVAHEHWDDEVPYGQPGIPGKTYENVTFQNFTVDNPQHVAEFMAQLDRVDYISLASRRLSGTIPRVPAEWPVASAFYDHFESLDVGETGALGFTKVAEFTSSPELFGREFDDTGAEESFSVYDHPKVQIFEKTDEYTPANARSFLGADAFIPGAQVLPGEAAQNGLEFRSDVLAIQKEGGTFSDIFDADSITNRFPLISWLLAMEIAALALVPLAIVGFRGLPDRGYLLTKPLGLLVLAYLSYFAAAHFGAGYTRWEIATALGLMVAAGVVTGYAWRGEIAAFARERWRFLIAAEGIFLLAFLFSYWIRLQNPDLWHPFNGGEKPMDTAYFIGATRTTDLTQGPIDPWHAGGYLNYYWYGQFISSVLTKLTGIVPEVAYNLVVPMFFALAAAATFSLAYNLAESTRRLMRRRPGGLPIGASGPIIAGVLAIFFVMVAGNLKAVGVLHDDLVRISPWNPDVPGGPLGDTIAGIIVYIGAAKEIAFGDATLRDIAWDYDWWAPSRALTLITDQNGQVTEKNSVLPITEFPFWTFLFADLHAHLMAIPFSMTAAAVAFGAVTNFTRLNPEGANGEHRRAREISSWALVLVLGLIVGSLRWINSWDYPPFLLIAAVGLILAERAKEGEFTLRAICMGLLKTVVMAGASYVMYINIAKNYNQAYSGIIQADQTTDLSAYLSHFGIFLFIITGFVLFNLNRSITRTNGIRALFFGRMRRSEAIETVPVMAVLILLGIVLIWIGTRERWGVTLLSFVGLAAVLLTAIRELRAGAPTAPIMLFVYAMLALGLGLCGGVELVTLQGDVGRMNTVFKFYLHVWMLWGVVAAFALWYLFAVMRPQEAFLKRAGAINSSLVQAPRYAFATFAAVLIALALVYPYIGTRARIHDRFNPSQGTGNDGLAFMDETPPLLLPGPFPFRPESGGEHNFSHTRDAINWVRENIDGSPTTFEALGPSYRSLGSRFSIYAGLPTVSGWAFHQSQQRVNFTASVQERERDVKEFYATEDVERSRELIRKYDVEWVFVGDEERFNFPPSGIEKFEDGLGGVLELMYENPSIQIWHVIPDDQLLATSSTSEIP